MRNKLVAPAAILSLGMIMASSVLAYSIHKHGIMVRNAGQLAGPNITLPAKHEVILYSDNQTKHGPVKVRMTN